MKVHTPSSCITSIAKLTEAQPLKQQHDTVQKAKTNQFLHLDKQKGGRPKPPQAQVLEVTSTEQRE